MADRYEVATPTDGQDIAAGTDEAIVQITGPADRRVKIIGFRFAGKETDVSIAPCQLRIIDVNSVGSGGSSITPTALDDPNAPAAGLALATTGRTDYSVTSVLRQLGQFPVQAAPAVEYFIEPMIVPVNGKRALIVDSAAALTGVYAALIIEV